MIDDEARRLIRHLPEILPNRIIDLDLRILTVRREVRRELRRLDEHPVRHLLHRLPARLHDHMRTRDPLRVEPEIPTVAEPEAHILILIIILPDEQLIAIARHPVVRLRLPLQSVLSLPRRLMQETEIDHLPTDILQILLGLRDVKRRPDRLEMLDLLSRLLELHRHVLLRALLLLVLLEIALRILRRREILLQRNRDLTVRIVVLADQMILPALQRVAVGMQQLPVHTILIHALGIPQLLLLDHQLLPGTLHQRRQYLPEIRRTLADTGALILLAVEAADDLAHRIEVLDLERSVLLIQREIEGGEV